ncbi:hypothetical protein AZZ92_001990, partial [Escherichia coli]
IIQVQLNRGTNGQFIHRQNTIK